MAKKKYIGAAGDYAKYEIAVIKALAKLLKKPYKKVIETVNLDQSLLDIISKNFDKKVSVSNCAKQLKAALIAKTSKTKTPLQAFVDILSKLPKKEQPKKYVLPLKFPATVSIGKVKKPNNYHSDKNSHNVKINVMSGLKQVINNSFYLDKVVSILNHLEKDIENLNISLKEKGLSQIEKNHIKVFLKNRKKQFSIAKKSLNTFASFR